MPHNLKIIEDFLPDPERVRQEIIRLPFYDIKLLGEMNKQIHPRNTDENKALLEKAVGRPVEQGYNIFRMAYEGQYPDEVVHQDTSIGEFIAVLYLSRPEDCRGGTALWRHKGTGREIYPTEFEVRRSGRSPKREFEKIHADARNADAWEQTTLVEMKFNRMVIFQAARFHSRFPRSGFGNCPENGRLIWVSFFECPK